MREESKKQAGTGSKPSYSMEELHFRMAQLEQTHQSDFEKIKIKLDKMNKKTLGMEFGF